MKLTSTHLIVLLGTEYTRLMGGNEVSFWLLAQSTTLIRMISRKSGSSFLVKMSVVAVAHPPD